MTAGLWAAMLILLLTQPSTPTVRDLVEMPMEAIPGVSVVYYDVEGRSARAVRRSIEQNRPADPDNPDVRFDAYTAWRLNSRWSSTPGEQCRIVEVRIEVSYTITFPRLKDLDQANRALRAEWQAYAEALERHEKQHVALTEAGIAQLLPELRDVGCDEIQQRIARGVQRIRDAHVEFDRVTNHGANQGVVFG